jgi:hypothetical protein
MGPPTVEAHNVAVDGLWASYCIFASLMRSRIQIRILVKSRIRIRREVKSWIRIHIAAKSQIRIKSIRNRNSCTTLIQNLQSSLPTVSELYTPTEVVVKATEIYV